VVSVWSDVFGEDAGSFFCATGFFSQRAGAASSASWNACQYGVSGGLSLSGFSSSVIESPY
jgi:hypothetical protein